MKCRKKPVVVEAIQVSDAIHFAASDWSKLPSWMNAAYESGDIVFSSECVHIITLEGNMRGDWSDWIIYGVKGEIYPCKPDIFEATYEKVEE